MPVRYYIHCTDSQTIQHICQFHQSNLLPTTAQHQLDSLDVLIIFCPSVMSSLFEKTMSQGQAVTVERASPRIPPPPYIGQEAPKESKFCPLAAVNKWPYKFFHHLDSETISQAFFAAGKFRMRGWTL